MRSTASNVCAEGLGGEVQASGQPEETFGGGVLPRCKFRLDERLKGRALYGRGELSFSYFLPLWSNKGRVLDGTADDDQP